MGTRRNHCIVATLFLTGLAGSAFAVGRQGPRLEQLMSADTLVFVAADARQLEYGVSALGLNRLLREDEVKQFLAPLYAEMEDLDPNDPLGTFWSWLDVPSWVRGEVGFGFAGIQVEVAGSDGSLHRVGLSASQPLTARMLHQLASIHEGHDAGPIRRVLFDFVLSVEPGPALAGMVRQYLAAPPAGTAVGQVTMDGVALTAVNIELDAGIETTLYADVSGDRWTIGGTQDSIMRALQGGGQDSLADSESFRNFRSRLAGDGNVVFAFLDVAKALSTFKNLFPPIVLEEAGILGIDSLTGVGLGMSMNEGGVRESILLGFDGAPKGLLSIFDAFGGGFPSLLDSPASTSAFLGIRFDANKLKDRALALAKELMPMAHGEVLAHFTDAQVAGHSLIEDVLPAFGSELGVSLSAPKNGMIPDVILSLEIRDPQKFARLFDTAKAMAEQETAAAIKPLALKNGEEGFVLSLPDVPVQPAFVLRGDRLIGAISPLTLKNYLYRHADAAEKTTLASANETLPQILNGLCHGREDLLSVLVYLDLRSAIPFLYDSAAPFLSEALAESGTGLDAAMLPMSDTIAPHLSGIAIGLSSGKEGLSIDVFSPIGICFLGGLAAWIEEGAPMPTDDTVMLEIDSD